MSNASKIQELDVTHTQHRLEYRQRIRELQKILHEKDEQLLKVNHRIRLMAGGQRSCLGPQALRPAGGQPLAGMSARQEVAAHKVPTDTPINQYNETSV
jgi:hypothetical protein